ncbi:hypothetical protein EV379_3310 [Microterricola gilva]|uniref:Alpha/beta hydrolase family protein n=1 Tax=Microterricola gilva TaxID=393267 RepID=A0A4Q8AQP4_9MICO|nr:alpha/beta hydrolase [Microterricola gilva]RZU66938.1 hypothetical protein EV379_3310 [Microterricola gilva]
MKRLLRPFWWWLDYVYAGWQQWRSLFRHRTPRHFGVGDPELPAVVLLPGVYETWLFLEPLATRLNRRGYRVFAIPELSFNRMPVLRSAEVVAAALRQLSVEHGITEFVLLAHSKGGLIGKKLMVSEHPGLVGMVAISTPFNGSSYAQFLPTSTLRAFSPNDEVLKELLTHLHTNEKIVSVYAEFDPHIPGKSAIEGGQNIELPINGHFLLLGNKLLGDTVEAAVDAIHGTGASNS